jgi:hypothetical protein
LKPELLNQADSIKQLDKQADAMQRAPVARKSRAVQLKMPMKPPAVDLWGAPEQPVARSNDRPEAAALAEVLKALRAHPGVAWCERQNSGAVRVGGRFVRFGWPGCPDVLGQLNDGRLLGVEVKAAKGRTSPEQVACLERINRAGGLAFVARDLRDVMRELETAKEKQP